MTRNQLFEIFFALYRTYGQEKTEEIFDSIIACLTTKDVDNLIEIRKKLYRR